MSVTIGGRREVVKFTHEEVTDLPLKGHLAAAQQAVMEKLKELVERFTPRKNRIGF